MTSLTVRLFNKWMALWLIRQLVVYVANVCPLLLLSVSVLPTVYISVWVVVVWTHLAILYVFLIWLGPVPVRVEFSITFVLDCWMNEKLTALITVCIKTIWLIAIIADITLYIAFTIVLIVETIYNSLWLIWWCLSNHGAPEVVIIKAHEKWISFMIQCLIIPIHLRHLINLMVITLTKLIKFMVSLRRPYLGFRWTLIFRMLLFCHFLLLLGGLQFFTLLIINVFDYIPWWLLLSF